MLPSPYPADPAERDRWVLALREQRAPAHSPDPWRPSGFFVEDECSASGEVMPVATIFLTNRECPWRCVMCDLWRNTLAEATPRGAIPAQIQYALARLPDARQIKLYNSGSFFDHQAIPPEDDSAIADGVRGFERLIVESHPALIGTRCLRLRDLFPGRLEVAMGLETAHPEILERLNKRMTLDRFRAAALTLKQNGIDLRVFVLVQPPFMRAEEAVYWAARSLDFAFECGATAVTLIPTRAGNGAVDALAQTGDFVAPRLETVEAAASYGIGQKRARVFVDLWDVQKTGSCAACHSLRVARLKEMNLAQTLPPPISCARCGGHS